MYVSLTQSQEIVLCTMLQSEDRSVAEPDKQLVNQQMLDWILQNVDHERIASLHPQFLAEVRCHCGDRCLRGSAAERAVLALLRVSTPHPPRPHDPPRCPLRGRSKCVAPSSLFTVALTRGCSGIVGRTDMHSLAEVELCWMHLLHHNERLSLACREILSACPLVTLQERVGASAPLHPERKQRSSSVVA